MSKKKKRRRRLGGQSSQNVAVGQRELIVRTVAQEPLARLRINPAGVEKMSDVLLRFAEPILDRSAPLGEKKATLLFAITAWNYCLTPPEEQPQIRGKLAQIFDNADYRADFEMLVQRKAELFPRSRRMFMGLEVTESSGRMHVNVVSTDLDRMG
jgi:hypothetical protein